MRDPHPRTSRRTVRITSGNYVRDNSPSVALLPARDGRASLLGPVLHDQAGRPFELGGVVRDDDQTAGNGDAAQRTRGGRSVLAPSQLSPGRLPDVPPRLAPGGETGPHLL